MERISISFWLVRATNCVCFILDKPINLLKPRGMRAKTDRVDAMTIARMLLSGEARRGYVPNELIATYRELVRLHSQLADEIARYKNEIQALLSVLFPEFPQVFTDPCRATAVALLKAYRSCTSHLGAARSPAQQ